MATVDEVGHGLEMYLPGRTSVLIYYYSYILRISISTLVWAMITTLYYVQAVSHQLHPYGHPLAQNDTLGDLEVFLLRHCQNMGVLIDIGWVSSWLILKKKSHL